MYFFTHAHTMNLKIYSVVVVPTTVAYSSVLKSTILKPTTQSISHNHFYQLKYAFLSWK